MGAKSSMAPVTARVFHSSDASPQPNRPAWSVITFTNIQFRISALTTMVFTSVIFIEFSQEIEEDQAQPRRGSASRSLTNEGAPYLARFSRDVGYHGSFPL